MRRKIISTSIIEFDTYPVGKEMSKHFKLPKGSEYLTLGFNKQGQLEVLIVKYESPKGLGSTMKTKVEFDPEMDTSQQGRMQRTLYHYMEFHRIVTIYMTIRLSLLMTGR